MATKHTSFDEFIVDTYRSPSANRFVKFGNLTLYVRKSIVAGVNFDLARFSSSKKGKGEFTAFLNRYEPLFVLRVENIFNERLIAFLLKRGYRQEKHSAGGMDMPVTLISPTPEDKPRILCVALRDKETGAEKMRPAPSRHHVLFEGVGDIDWSVAEQGFVDTHGIFHNRKFAKIIAIANKQLLHTASPLYDLFSEDLW